MSYRDDLAALSARHAALESEVTQKTRELEQATRLLEDARTRARLPVLDNIRVATPCRADWAQMTGDDRVRHCDDCSRDVFNLSGMTRDEAEALILEKAGQLCVRYVQRADGTILLKDDCEVGVVRRRRNRRRAAVFAGAAAMLAGVGAALSGRTASPPEPEQVEIDPSTIRMGKYDGVVLPPVTPPPSPEAMEPPPRHTLGALAIEPLKSKLPGKAGRAGKAERAEPSTSDLEWK